MDWLLPLYPWVKSLHVIAVITWMAGLFYLPRLFIYHMAEPVGSPTSETFKTMERRLLRAIMNPSLIVAWAMGLTLVATPGVIDWRAGWWHTKLLAVVLMTVVHMHQAAGRSALARDERPHTARYWRIANEVPSLLLIIIITMVIARPF